MKQFQCLLLFICCISNACFANSEISKTNSNIVSNFYTDVWTKGHRDKVGTYVSKSVSGQVNGNLYTYGGLVQRLEHFDNINKNISADIHELFTQGDKVAVYVTICSTLKSNNMHYCIPNLGIYTIRGNKITKFVTTSPVPNIYRFKPKK